MRRKSSPEPPSRSPSRSPSRPSSGCRFTLVPILGLALVLGPFPAPARATEPMKGTAVADGFGELPPTDVVRVLRRAEIAHQRADHAAEKMELRAAHSSHPDDLLALQRLVAFYRQHEVGSDEELELAGALASRLADPSVRWPVSVLHPLAELGREDPLLLSSILDHLERRHEAGETLDRRSLELWRSLAEHLGDGERAHWALRELMEGAAGDARLRDEYRWALVRSYEESGQDERALELLGDWLEKEPSFRVQVAFLRAASRLGRFEAMKEILPELEEGYIQGGAEGSVVVARASAELLVELAWNFRDAGDDAAAHALLRAAAERRPEAREFEQVRVLLYGTAEEQAALQAAEADRLAAIEDPETLFEEGTQLLTNGDAAGAYGLLLRASRALPAKEAAWYNLGMAAYQVEEWETAAEALKRAAQLKPSRVESHFFGGLASEKLDRCQESVEALGKAVALDPDRAIAHYYLSACYTRLGDTERSIHHGKLYREKDGG